MKVRAETFGQWKPCFWKPAYFIVTTKVAPHKKIIFPKIIIWVHRGNRFTDRVAKSLYLNDNRDFRVRTCEGAGKVVIAIEPAHRARPKADDSAKEREKFE